MPVEVLEHVLGALHEGVLVVDAAGRRVYANEEAARLTGYPSADALLEAPPEEAAARFEIRDRVRAAARADRASRPPGVRQARTPSRCSSASGQAAAPSASRRCGAPRSATRTARGAYVITFFREVTEQVIEADQVRRSTCTQQQTTALLDALYGSAPVGLGFWDRDLRYVRVNEALARINERSAEDHVGRTFREVVPQLADELELIARGVLETWRGRDRARDDGGHAREPGRAAALARELLPGDRAGRRADRRRRRRRGDDGAAPGGAAGAGGARRSGGGRGDAAEARARLAGRARAPLAAGPARRAARAHRRGARGGHGGDPARRGRREAARAGDRGRSRRRQLDRDPDRRRHGGQRRRDRVRRCSCPTCRRSSSTARRCATAASTRSSRSRSSSRTA